MAPEPELFAAALLIVVAGLALALKWDMPGGAAAAVEAAAAAGVAFRAMLG